MKQNTKPVITLKNIKHSEFASEETHCYQATIYVDGKKFATASNDGCGGPDNVEPFSKDWKDLQSLEECIAATYPKWGSKYGGEDNMEMTLDILCGDLVNDWLRRKDFKRAMRQILYVKSGERAIFKLAAKYKPTAEMIERIKAVASWATGATFLHELPEAEAFELYTSRT